MKKKLLSLSLFVGTLMLAQSPAADWSTLQNTKFTNPSATTKFLDVVDANVIWSTGRSGVAADLSGNYNWYSTSSDGGVNFTSGNIFPDTNTYIIGSIEGINATTAWVTGWEKAGGNKGYVYKTTDGGATWVNGGNTNMFINAASFANLTCFTNATTGITMGDPVGGEFEIYRTTDGGTTWTMIPGANIPNPVASEVGSNNIYTKAGSHIWFGTTTGRVFHSMDDGLNWTVGTTAATKGITDLAFRDDKNGLAYGLVGTTLTVYKTTDGGATWTVISPIPANMGKSDICAIPGTNYYASCGAETGNYVISYSSDNGTTWTDWGSTGIQYTKIDFANVTVGWAGTFSDPGDPAIGGIYKYTGNIATGIKSLAQISETNLFPNPTSGIINITLPLAKHGMTLNIIDALGKIVYSENVSTFSNNETKQFNLDFLAKGLYTINFNVDGNISYSKIVVQ